VFIEGHHCVTHCEPEVTKDANFSSLNTDH
jgi:hypothetical protein